MEKNKVKVLAAVAVAMMFFAGCSYPDDTDNGGGNSSPSGEASSSSGGGGGGGAGTTRSNATSVAVGNSSSHNINLNGEHWFKFEGDGNPIIFETTGDVVDTYMDTYEGNGTYSSTISGTANDNSGEGSNALVSYISTKSGSTYFIKITTKNQTSGTYSFVVKQPTANIRTNPISVTEGYSSPHIINSSSTHWFSFQGTGNSVVFETEGNVVNTSINLFVGNNTSAILTASKRISFSTISGTTYYISITGNAGTYTFNVSNAAGDGSSRSFAIPVEIGNSTSHNINLNGAHWFIFVGTGNPVTFETTGDVVDTYMDTYEGNGTYSSTISGTANDNSGEGSNAKVRINPSTSGSTYFIKITQKQSTQGTYTFLVKEE